MANLLKTFSSEIDIVNGPVHQIFPEPVILNRTSVVEDYKVISLVANGSFAVIITVKNNGVLVDLTSPTVATMNASIFDDTSVASVELSATYDAGLSTLASGEIAFICPINTLPSLFATSFDRKPLGTVEIDIELEVGGHTEHIYDRVNVIDNSFGGTGGVLPVDATQFVSKAEIVDTKIDQVQLGVQAHSTQTANVFEAKNDAGTVNGGFNADGFAFGIAQTEITGKTEVTVDGADHILVSDASDGGALKKVLASDFGGGGSGDVVGPVSAVDENIAVYDSTTGKLIKDGGINKSAITTNTAKVTNATHTGDVTGSTSLTLSSTAITGQSLVTAASSDHVLVADASDSGNLKKVLVSDLGGGGGGSGDVVGPASSTDDNLATFDLATGKLIQDSGINISAVTANTSKVTNATHTGDVTGSGALTLASVAITGQSEVTVDDADHILISDASDSGNLKKVLASDFGGGGGGNFPTSTDSGDKTTAYSIVAGDENTTVVAGSATTADFTITYDLSLWTTAGSLLTIANESSYIVKVLVSNTGTMTIGGGIDKFIGPNGTITMAADTATHVRVVART